MILLCLLLLSDWRADVERLKARGDATGALAMVEQQAPRTAAFEDEVGFLLAALGRRAEAILRFRQAIHLLPANAAAHYARNPARRRTTDFGFRSR